MEDGFWCLMKFKKEVFEVCFLLGYGLDGFQYSLVQEGNLLENKKKVEVIDLIIESLLDEEDLFFIKKYCFVILVVILVLFGSKGVLMFGYQLFLVLRSFVMGVLGGDFLFSFLLYEYLFVFLLGVDI